MFSRSLLAIVRFIALTIPVVAVSFAHPQEQCNFGSPEAAGKLEKSLQQAPSCKSASNLYNECRWGSSADSGFAAIVINKCERAFIDKLNPAQKKIYEDRRQLCTYEYGRQEGTLAISESASCHVDVAVGFAEDLSKAAVPLPAASFDCGAARSPLERAICSDSALGRADLVLMRAYSGDLKSAKGSDKASLIRTEQRWLGDLSAKCRLAANPPSPEVLGCLRNEFERRFTLLDECGIGELGPCLAEGNDSAKAP